LPVPWRPCGLVVEALKRSKIIRQTGLAVGFTVLFYPVLLCHVSILLSFPHISDLASLLLLRKYQDIPQDTSKRPYQNRNLHVIRP